MQKLISLILGAFLMFTFYSVTAIDPPTKTKKKVSTESLGYEISSSVYQNAVFQSNDNKQVFIDFSDIPVNLKCVQVMDGDGTVLFKKSVYKMPVTSLLEIDLSTYSVESFVLEIQTFTDSRFIQLGSAE